MLLHELPFCQASHVTIEKETQNDTTSGNNEIPSTTNTGGPERFLVGSDDDRPLLVGNECALLTRRFPPMMLIYMLPSSVVSCVDRNHVICRDLSGPQDIYTADCFSVFLLVVSRWQPILGHLGSRSNEIREFE
jgi:hypothetical protein